MTEKVPTIDVCQRIGDMLNRVALRHDEFIIERKGKPLAALVPVERLEQMRRFARQALDFLEQQKGGPLTDEQVIDLALADACPLGACHLSHRLSDAQRHVRGRLAVRDSRCESAPGAGSHPRRWK